MVVPRVQEFTLQQWCGVCKFIEPEYKRFVDIAAEADLPLVVARVNCNDEQELEERFQVSMFPTFKLFKQALPNAFPWSATAEAMLFHASKIFERPQRSPARVFDDQSDLFRWLFWRGTKDGRFESSLVLYMPPGARTSSSELEGAFDDVAAELLDARLVRFAKVVDEEIMSTFNLSTAEPTLVLYKDFDEGRNIFEGVPRPEEIKEFINTWNTPLVTFIDHKNLLKHKQRDNVLGHIFISADDYENRNITAPLQRQLFQELVKVEKELLLKRGEFTIGITNGNKYVQWMKEFDLERDRFPSAGINRLPSGELYVFNPERGETVENFPYERFSTFVHRVLHNDMTPSKVIEPEDLSNV